MSGKKKKHSPYQNYLMRKALRFVFNTVRFDNPYTKSLVYESYLLNLGLMRQYARDNRIDEMSYILSIRDELLKSPGVYKYECR
jgi:hypothetical protein